MLKLADNLSLPIDAVTETIAIVAKRRVGKSYTMRRLVEQLLNARQQVVLVDPKGDQWGIRSAADGKGPGFPVMILGGERGDVPLEPGGGELVAKLVVEERVSILLDLSHFRKYEVATFMALFLETLYRLKAQEVYRTPMMLVIDEADAIAPQNPQKGEERMLGAAEDIVRRGGQRGIGCLLVTQRTAVLNKNVLTQAQILVALRTIAPQDIKAMDAWIHVHGDLEQRTTLMESLPSLPVGDAWFWSPGWPTASGIFKRVHVLPIETFDSAATPKPGQKRVEPKTVADVDLDVLKRQMAATIERAKADDPRELRKTIARLEAENRTLRAQPAPAAEIQRIEVPVLTDAQLSRLETMAVEVRDTVEKFGAVLGREVLAAVATMRSARAATPKPSQPVSGRSQSEPRPARTAIATTRAKEEPVDHRITLAERKVLTVLAQYPDGRTKRQVAVLAGYAVNGGGFNNAISACRSRSWLIGTQDRLQATDEGLSVLGSYDPLPTGRDLLIYWLGQLSKAERSILEALAERYPEAITKEQLGTLTGYEPHGGGFNNALSRLRTLELIDGRGEIRMSEELA